MLGGALTGGGARYSVDPGWLAAATVARRWIGGAHDATFLATSLTVGLSSTHTSGPAGEHTPLLAQDSRIGLVVGRTLAHVWSPYLLLRGFGGPVFWKIHGSDVTGGDRHHYAIGLGGSLRIQGAVDVVGEGAFFGERSLALGVNVAL